MLIAGDAAHTFSPVGGQGMNAGIHDAANLAWKLASICAGDAPVRLAETYESERRAAALDTFERTERLAGALTESNPVLRAARDLVGAAARVVPAIGAPLGRGLGGMDTVYSPGSYSAGAVTEGPWIDGWGRPGERMDTPVPELLADGRYHLVLTGHALMAGDVERVVDLAEGHEGGTVVHLLDPDVGGSRKGPRRRTRPWPTSDPADRPIPEHPHVVLVRPDGHIGWTGRLEDADLLGAHMDRWLARR